MVNEVSRRIVYTGAILLFCARLSSGQAGIHVNEVAARIQIQRGDKVLALTVELPVENPGSETLQAHMKLELLDPNDRVLSRADRDMPLAPGSSPLKISLPALPVGTTLGGEALLWSRLRYTITTLPSTTPPALAVEGIIAAGVIAPQLFDLHVVSAGVAQPGAKATLRVRATHPVTGKPVAKVTVQAALESDDDDDEKPSPSRPRPAVTDRDGFATLELTVPKKIDEDEYQLGVTVTGTLGGLSVEASGNLLVYRSAFACLSTDKRLYQPGQTVHMRLLAFGEGKKALADQPVTIEIKDPEYTVQFVAHARTSRFGIAAADWPIPENLRLGNYSIRANFDDNRYESARGYAAVKISRYELPTFMVTAKPDRAYYLPGQNADIEVRADYIFGKPVRSGHVRVVHEDHREWNYREQKWDIDEGNVYEGDTDASGRYVAHVDLSDDHDELAEDDYQRFHDLHLAAYFTDASTHRTEQRRFDVRLTKEPIHVYVIADGYRLESSGLPLEFIVSTDYADGTPAPCDVQVSWLAKPEKNSAGAASEMPLRRVRTNRYGLAEVSGLKVPGDPDQADAYLNFRAEDRQGNTGEHAEELTYRDEPAIRVTTDKVLYRSDEPIEVSLASNQRHATVFVDAVADFQVLSTHVVALAGGRATLVLPPSDKFRDAVTILAYGFGHEPGASRHSMSAFGGSRTVLFPRKHDLQLEVRPEKTTYRPGDEAIVNFHVSGPEGESLESALGLVVVDKALEERQRTEEEFGSIWGFYGFERLWGEEESIKGVRRKDLDKLDLSLPLPPGLDLVAEVLLRGGGGYFANFESDSGWETIRGIYSVQIDPQMKSVHDALAWRYQKTGEYPKSMEMLTDELAKAGGPQFDQLRDPWGQPYHVAFSVSGPLDMMIISSAGPDKKFGTEDDLDATRMGWPYFKSRADAIQKAVDDFHQRTGGCIRDLPNLQTELKRQGLDLAAWKDPWGHPYRYTFGVAETMYTVTVTSAGPDGRFGTDAAPSEDDFVLTTAPIDYTLEIQNQVGRALDLQLYGKEKTAFPQNVEELQKVLRLAGIEWESLKDPWGHRYYATFRQDAMYADRLTIETYAEYGQPSHQHTTVVPVTRTMNWIYIRSAGEDGIEGTKDDFTITVFSRAMLEQAANEKSSATPHAPSVLVGATGAISGVVTDPSGAVIPGAEISARNLTSNVSYTATTDQEGKYTLRNLPSGFYYVTVSKQGFKIYAVTDVPLQSSNITQLDVALQVGAVTQTVEVSGTAPQLQTEASSVSAEVRSKSGLPSVALHPALATPRLREYFPETLLWQPELVTDGKGRAHVKFPLAGSITTWKLAAVASSVDGQIGSAEKEIRAFQPFFVEHDPPRVLTAGDEIALPVVVRNYLDHPVQANLEMSAQSWFSLASPPQTLEIAANDAASKVFRFTAVTPVKQGKQRVTARSSDVADAIEKTVTVHPNGQEKIDTLSGVFADTEGFDVRVPDNMLPGSLQTTLKIYPNLNAHVLESIDAIMARPYGCAEQIISAAYPSILYLRYTANGDKKDAVLSERARRNVQLGYARLLSLQAENGGFTYWGRGEPDLALTAYAIRFLADANTYIAVDPSVIEQALSWLLQQVQTDGRWIALRWDKTEEIHASAQLTAYIARMIAAAKLPDGDDAKTKVLREQAAKTVKRALDFVEPYVAELAEPYLIAAYTLAALDTGQDARAASSLRRLRTLAHREGSTSYWALEMNTPFCGWGIAGRVEATSLVLQAVERAATTPLHAPEDEELISRGWLFLFKHQDGYGIWYTTQATIDVLDAIAALSGPLGGTASGASQAEIFVDGRHAASVDLPGGNQISPPVLADLSGYLSAGAHHVEVRRPPGGSRTTLQLVVDYYVPWTSAPEAADRHHEEGSAEALRLSVHYDRESAQPGDTINCNVDAERIGFRGYGMMLAEVGLPPGAEVDRATLEKAMIDSGWSISQYDILPDRLVLYLWPRAGGVKLSFAFKFRYGMKALSTRSVLYDYYNPEAYAEVQPTRFLVK